MLPLTTILYPSQDLAASKDFFATLLGAQPFADSPHYVGFQQGAIQIGLHQGQGGAGGSVVYWDTTNLRQLLTELEAKGGAVKDSPRDVGGGLTVATIADPSGNLVGLRQPLVEG